MMSGKIEQRGWLVPESQLQALRDIWYRFRVDGIMEDVGQRLVAGLVDTRITPGNPSFVAAIGIFKPRIISSLEFWDKTWDVNDESKWEEKDRVNRAYAIGLNNDGFFARYHEFSPVWIGRPERIGGHRKLVKLIDEHIETQKKKRPSIGDLFLANLPEPYIQRDQDRPKRR